VNHILRGRRGARLAAITSGGAIPDNANYLVVAEPEGATVGTVDEDFAVESMSGDVFLLGTASWRIRRVETAACAWRTPTARLRRFPSGMAKRPAAPPNCPPKSRGCARISWPRPSPTGCCAKPASTASARSRPSPTCNPGARALGVLPASAHVVAERFFDEGGGMQFVLHAPFGARVNRAWGLALRKRFCRTFNFELQAAATDNGIVLSLGEQHAFPLDIVFEFLRPETVEDVLTQALLDAPMFTARWRWNASRALAILRFSHGARVPAPIQRMRSDDLLAATFPDQAACAENLTGPPRIPDHPLVRETIRNCLHEAMDLERPHRRARRHPQRRHPHIRHRHAGSYAVFARDPERQSLRVSGRRAAGGTPRSRRAVAAHGAHGLRRRRGRARSRRHRASGRGGLAAGARSR
jgi:ATP-dependent helicase Lhr and Lhr-like helicase